MAGTPENVAHLLGGFCTSAQLREAGITPHSVRAAVAEGRLVRLRRGAFAVPGAHPGGVAAIVAGGRLAGLSATESRGLWGGWHEPLHVAVPKNADRIRGGARRTGPSRWTSQGRPMVVHWNDDRRDVASCWRVSLSRSVRQVLRWHDFETARAVIDTALTAGLLSPDDLPGLTAGVLEHLSGRVALCRPGSDSGIESIACQRLEAIGLEMRQQVDVPGVGSVDLAVVGTRVFIELDGYAFHSSPSTFAKDRRRDAEARSRKYIPLRFTATQVMTQWPWVERMVLATLGRAS